MEITISKMQAQDFSAGENQSSFDMLFQQHWEPVCALLYRMTGDWHETQDLALETFVKLYQHPPSQPDNLKGWLYRVAVHLGLNALRAGKRRRFYELQSIEVLPAGSKENDPAQIADQSQNRRKVQYVLAEMKPRSAQLLMLRYSGFSYAELASIVKINPKSVGKFLARAEKEFEKIYLRLEAEREL
jgi:RNA polymerase sigma-70 factor (ECF subfamily)